MIPSHFFFGSMALLFASSAFAISADSLETGFLNPPESAKPQTWWHWMNGNVTKEGIKADLEAMKQIGLGGATVFNLGCDIPFGGVSFMSPEWQDDFQFAVQEADRVGIKLSVLNCAGWSNSGGPWITPENAMQRITSSETRVTGPADFEKVLPPPPVNLGFYRDIAVLAFPVPSNGSGRSDHPDALESGKLEIKQAVYEGRDNGGSADVTRRLNDLMTGGHKSVVVGNEEMGGDPAIFSPKQLRVNLTLDGKPATVMVSQGDTFIFPDNASRLAAAAAFDNTLVARTFVQPPPASVPFSGRTIALKDVVDLTSKLGPDGRLRWKAPPGDWIILRFGYTPIGKKNHPAPEGGEGLECDKLSKAAMDAHWHGFMQKVLDDAGPLSGKTLNASLIDSYEVGNQDWTGDFREQFMKRRGYDPLPYLIVFDRYLVDSPEITARFLWDMRRTVSDLFAENYYGHFAELCRRHGILSYVEPYTGPFESLQCGAAADVVMGEFWANGEAKPTARLAASAAHIYGKSIVGAESFTGWPSDGRWLADPYYLKPLGDLMFCEGINSFTFHRYAMQPWPNRQPGMTMGPFGINFERTQTWWKQGKSWIDYISRCQFLLQQGRTIADAAYFVGQSSPVATRTNDPALPPGYSHDEVNSDVLVNGASVKEGRLTLASGANYAVLVLPSNDASMTPALLTRLSTLVREGATIIGPPPQRSPSLQDYPRSDQVVAEIAKEMWGKCDGKTVLENNLGKGRIVWGKPLADILASEGLKPDFEFRSDSADTQLAYTHRADEATDIYFVSNQRRQSDSAKCIFRIADRVPELWHPDTGVTETAPIWSVHDGRTTVDLTFEPAGSVFVVFRNAPANKNYVISASKLASENSQPKLKIRHAEYAPVDGPEKLDVTAKISVLVRDDRLVVDVSTGVLGGDPAPFREKELRVDYTLDGQNLSAVARENDTLTLGSPRQWEVYVTEGGAAGVRTWSDSQFELHTADGKTLRAESTGLPGPRQIEGSWNLKFPPLLGAPPTITLNELISWPDHPDPAVRYFSGTATYERDLEIDPELLTAGRELWLDLGAVKNFAEVSLNGHDLGVLWKPPFLVNITEAAKAGTNKLAIKVTNLWPNRLIGDEQLPADVEWRSDGGLAGWPQWFLDGKPSPSGRITFTTWHHWTKDAPLLPSGLLGPVWLRPAGLVQASEPQR
jgi:hypothetical protein